MSYAIDFPCSGTVVSADGDGKCLLKISLYMYSSFVDGGDTGNLLAANFICRSLTRSSAISFRPSILNRQVFKINILPYLVFGCIY